MVSSTPHCCSDPNSNDPLQSRGPYHHLNTGVMTTGSAGGLRKAPKRGQCDGCVTDANSKIEAPQLNRSSKAFNGAGETRNNIE